jgi:hypothetical protein
MIVGSPFHRLNLDPALACEFLAVFARFEFALKAAGFVDGDEKKAEPAWDRYARAIDAAFTHLKGAELRVAVAYLLLQPPKKQIVVQGKIDWLDAPPDGNLPRAEQVLLMVRRVRNNLFHGGKFLAAEAGGDPDRDRLLVDHALMVLRACLPLHQDVAAAYEN